MHTMRVGLLSVVPLFGGAAAAQVDWIPRGGGWLTARHGLAFAYDSQARRTLAFGGDDGALTDDTWHWDGAVWWPATTGSAPSSRHAHAMAYDALRGRVVMFGGWNLGAFGDTWEWHGSTWTQVATTGPSPRSGAALVHDSQRGRCVLFGGFAGSFLGDTWEWDGTAWSLVAAAGPWPRHRHAMAFDSLRGRTVLFGGASSGTTYQVFDDTWEWDGAAWSLAAATGPGARVGHAMAFDSQRGTTVLFGGELGGLALQGDTWQWQGAQWVQLATSPVPPRTAHAMAYDSDRHCLVLFGGHGGTIQGLLGDTWELTSTASSSTPFGAGCGTPPLGLAAVAGAPPAIGTTALATISASPSSMACVAMGWDRQWLGPLALPLSLASLGMPGCELLHSADVFGLAVTFTGAGTATFAQPVPNLAALVGRHVHLQAFAVAVGANPGQVVASNALDWGIGR